MIESIRKRTPRRSSRITLFIVFLAVTVACTTRPAATNADDPDEAAEVLAIDSLRAKAFVDGNIDFLEEITGEGYTHVETSGLLRTKAEFISFLQAGEVRFLSFNIETNEARVLGDVALVTGTYNNQIATASGPQPVKRARHQRVYFRINNSWQVVAHQATEIAGERD